MPNSQICVVLMVSAPIYVAQKQMSYLRDPENKVGALGGVKIITTKYKKHSLKRTKTIVAPPGE